MDIGTLKRLAKRLGALSLLRPFNGAVRELSATTHRWQHELECNYGDAPEWYDTFMGQHYRWPVDRVSWIWDRGVFSAFAMKPDARVLDICCGGGFFTYHFYSGRAAGIIGVDFDPRAIANARRYCQAPNIRYEVVDVRTDLPAGPFDHVVWDGAIEHFTPGEIDAILSTVRDRMSPGAMLTGYTIQKRPDRGLHHPLHEYEFSSKADLARFFTPHFRNVLVFETIYPERHNLHFIGSDGVLPFDANWPHSLRSLAARIPLPDGAVAGHALSPQGD